jgi:hypothetical protein
VEDREDDGGFGLHRLEILIPEGIIRDAVVRDPQLSARGSATSRYSVTDQDSPGAAVLRARAAHDLGLGDTRQAAPW